MAASTPSTKPTVISAVVGAAPAALGVVAPATEPVVTPEVTAAAPVVEAPAPVRRFATTTEDAPATSALPPALRKLNPKTLAEQAAGKRAISAYIAE